MLPEDLHKQGVQEQDRIDRVQRTGLPGRNFVGYGVGDSRDQFGRDGHPVEVFHVALDIARAHAPCVHGDDLVVEVGPTGLVLADQLGIEGALAVPGDLYRQIAPVVLERLGGLAVARVAAVPAVGGMLLLAEMIAEFGFQDPFGHALLHAPIAGRLRRRGPRRPPRLPSARREDGRSYWGLLVSGHSTSSL